MILANGCNITKSEKCKGVWILSVPTVYIKKAENTLPELLLLFYSIEPQMSTIRWFGFFFKQKKV